MKIRESCDEEEVGSRKQRKEETEGEQNKNEFISGPKFCFALFTLIASCIAHIQHILQYVNYLHCSHFSFCE